MLLLFQVNEAAIIKMFADIADEGNPEIATMEGMFSRSC